MSEKRTHRIREVYNLYTGKRIVSKHRNNLFKSPRKKCAKYFSTPFTKKEILMASKYTKSVQPQETP